MSTILPINSILSDLSHVVLVRRSGNAGYILSSSLMKRIIDFRQRTGKNIKISFVKSSLFIAIPYKKALFEPRYYTSIISEDKTTEYFLDLEMAIGIVTELNLNTRIWSKQ